jgi:drug/metabolite transporter (DMT)-like permease
MPMKLLLVTFTVNAVISQLILRRATRLLPVPPDMAGLPRFIASAAVTPWIYAALVLQVIGYVLWMLVVQREKLGVATASVGAGFYGLMALSAWVFYGEALSALQWTGILLVTLGVIFISQGQL